MQHEQQNLETVLFHMEKLLQESKHEHEGRKFTDCLSDEDAELLYQAGYVRTNRNGNTLFSMLTDEGEAALKKAKAAKAEAEAVTGWPESSTSLFDAPAETQAPWGVNLPTEEEAQPEPEESIERKSLNMSSYITDAIKRLDGATVAKLATELGIDKDACKSACEALIVDGVLVRDKKTLRLANDANQVENQPEHEALPASKTPASTVGNVEIDYDQLASAIVKAFVSLLTK